LTKGELATAKAELTYAKHRLLLLSIYQKNIDQQRDYYTGRITDLEAAISPESSET
jgi:hypothetical protein